METLSTILCRKSIRNFKSQISDDQLKLIIKAGMAAPIGLGAYDDMHLSVITNPELLDKIDRNAANVFNRPELHPIYGAPTLIIVSTKLKEDDQNNVSYSNCAGIIENMTIEAVDLGVGCCHIWGTIRALLKNPELVAELNLPEGFSPCSALALGLTDEKYEIRRVPENRIKVSYIK